MATLWLVAQTGVVWAQALAGSKISGIRFTGETALLNQNEQSSIIDKAVGQPLELGAIQGVADLVTATLQAKGYILAWAALPPQDVTSGVVEIEIRQGTIEAWDFRIDDDVRIAPKRLDAIAHFIAAPGEPITRQGLERALLLMGDQAGVVANGVLQAGSRAGTTRIVVQVGAEPSVSGRVSLNNYGSSTTGAVQASLALQILGGLQSGERIDVSTSYARGMGTIRIAGDVGVHPSGLRLNASANSLNYAVVEGDGAAAEITGASRSWGADLRYPLVRSRATNVWVTAGYDGKLSVDRAMGVVTKERRVTSASVELSGDTVDGVRGGGQTFWSVGVTSGNVELLQGVDHDGTAGAFSKVTGSIRRLQNLGSGFTLLARLSGQAAGSNLDASEGFSLGGPYGVRAYPVGEGSGDSGWIASMELRRDLAIAGLSGSIQGTVFVDYGAVQLYHTPPATIPTATGENVYSLAGWGASLVWRVDEHTRLEAGYAHAIGDNPGRTIFDTHADGTTQMHRVWVEASVVF